MKIEFTKENLKMAGEVGLRIGKRIAIEGTKAVVLKGAVVAIEASFENGIDGIKDLKLSKIIGEEKSEKKKKMSFFNRKEVVDAVVDITSGE